MVAANFLVYCARILTSGLVLTRETVSSPVAQASQVTAQRPWRYADTSKRDLRLDFLRGFAILVLIVDHIIVADSWLYKISGNAEFIISAAELFYAISGVVIGVVASRQAETVAIRRSLRRAWELYLAAISIALLRVSENPCKWPAIGER